MTSRRTLYTKCALGLLCALAINLPAHAGLPVSTTNISLPALSAAGSFKPDTVVPNEVLVKFGSSISAQDMTPTLNTMASSVKQINRSGLTLVKLTPGTETISSAMSTLRAMPGVISVQPNFIYHSTALPNDPQIGQQWALKNTGQTIANSTYELFHNPSNNPGTPGDDIDAEGAWQYQSDCSSVTVAVVDTGINYTQQDLVNSMWNGGTSYPNHGYDFVDNDNDPYPTTGDELHATHVAGIIGAEGNNGIEGSGVCQKANIMSVRVLNSSGGSTASVVQGVYFAVDHGARIINMSLGNYVGFDQAFSDAISYAQSKGVLVVVAAGNGDSNGNGVNVDQTPFYPCDFTQDNLICVAALDQSFQLASFSNYGATTVDVGAPGTNILSTIAGPSQFTDFTNWSNLNSPGWTAGTGISTATGATFPALFNPANYGTSNYISSTDDHTWRSFSFLGAQHVTLSYYLHGSVATGDNFYSGVIAGSQDPFGTGGSILQSTTGTLTSPLSPYQIEQCANSTCSIGFRLLGNGHGGDIGPLVALFTLNTIASNSNDMGIENGTSMAAPMVSGIAALLMASAPGATYQQVAQAIKASGVSVPSLAGITTTGKAVNAMRALANLHLGISGLSNLSGAAGQPLTVTFNIGGLGTLGVSASSSNTLILPNTAITGQSSCTQAGSCTIQLTPVGAGTTTVYVTVNDTYGQQATGSFLLTIPSSGGGGGSMNWMFLLVLAVILGAVQCRNRRIES